MADTKVHNHENAFILKVRFWYKHFTHTEETQHTKALGTSQSILITHSSVTPNLHNIKAPVQ